MTRKAYCRGCHYKDENCDLRRGIYKEVCPRRVLSEAQEYPCAHGKVSVHVSEKGEWISRKG